MKKLTHEEYLSRVFEVCGNEYSVLEDYIDIKTTLLTKHNLCNHEWKISPNKFLMGRRCPKCGRNSAAEKNRQTLEQIVLKLKNIFNDEIKIISGTYKNDSSKFKFFHSGCNRYFEDEIKNIFKRKSCLLCKKISPIRKTQDKFVEEIYNKYKNEYKVVGKYETANTHILMRHTVCGTEWPVTPSNLLRGYGCPKCNESKGEKEISKFLEKNNIKNIPQYKFKNCKNILPLPFDFYLPDYNLCIEYDGELHYQVPRWLSNEDGIKNLKDCQFRDSIKNKYCLDNNIQLIRIPYWEFNNIELILEQELS